jgi:hypothetical protein
VPPAVLRSAGRFRCSGFAKDGRRTVAFVYQPKAPFTGQTLAVEWVLHDPDTDEVVMLETVPLSRTGRTQNRWMGTFSLDERKLPPRRYKAVVHLVRTPAQSNFVRALPHNTAGSLPAISQHRQPSPCCRYRFRTGSAHERASSLGKPGTPVWRFVWARQARHLSTLRYTQRRRICRAPWTVPSQPR